MEREYYFYGSDKNNKKHNNNVNYYYYYYCSGTLAEMRMVAIEIGGMVEDGNDDRDW